ncbi:MAG: cell shape determining protein MreB/Mrl [Haloplasmataceae bacterium]|jgi:rod shape-determining protein MreB|nr:cell shape determining protein MreB/Mrl [Haloplasmataceae bacterium]
MAKKSFKIGVDLGTANILVYINGSGVVFNQPSVVAFDRTTNKCIAVGKQAAEMVGKEHSHIKIVRPLDGGVIADLEATKVYLEYVFEKLESTSVDLKNSTLLLCCPSEVSEIERVALLNLAKNMGVKDAFVEEELKAGAIGAGVDIFSPRGAMVIDIGGGTTDIGVLSLGDIVVSESVKVAGEFLDKEITKYVKYKYGLLIGSNTAEQIKLKLGTLSSNLKEEKSLLFAGRSVSSGLPTKVLIKQSEIRDLTVSAFQSVINKIIKVLQQTPPELASDIFQDGILINGGGSLTEGIKEYFEEALGLSVRLATNPLTSIVEGTKVLLLNRGNYLVKPTDF